MQINLKGRTAVVCGSTKGIGRAIALQMAQSGANIVLVARNEDALKATMQMLDTSQGQQHNWFTADFQNTDSLANALKNWSSEKIAVDILVNNTGGPAPGPASSADPQEFVKAFNWHLVCNQMLVQAFLPGMKTRGFGRIINVISTSVKIPLHGLGVSNTIRGAVANWSKTLANELASSGITVNNVLPGATATERLEGIIKNKALKSGKSEAECEQEMLHEIPAGRFGKPEELAYAATFLASDQAAYITGTNVVVDGGRTGNL
jgi:3-oxoacyl-[acyl-carrier protein] reductase